MQNTAKQQGQKRLMQFEATVFAMIQIKKLHDQNENYNLKYNTALDD